MTDEQFYALLNSFATTNELASKFVWFIPLMIAIATGVSWLFQEFYKSRLQHELESYKSSLSAELQTEIESHKARLNEQVQNALNESSSRRQYEAEARKRLYQAIGPLRFQLLLACRDAIGRIERLVSEETYNISLDSYFGRNTIYRILRPIALCDLIESRMAMADFSVDKDAIECLRLRRSYQKALSSEIPIASLPGSDWSNQTQHVFADKISKAAHALKTTTENGEILRFHDFEVMIEKNGGDLISPFQGLLEGFSPKQKPLLWVRLVAFALSSDKFLGKFGADAGFEYEALDIRLLLSSAKSPLIDAHLEELVHASNLVANTGL